MVVDLPHLWGHGRKWNKFPLSFYHFLLPGKGRLLSFTCCFSCQQEKLVLSQMINNVCCGEGIPRCGYGNADLPFPAFCFGLVLPGPAQTAVAGMCQLLVSVTAGWQGRSFLMDKAFGSLAHPAKIKLCIICSYLQTILHHLKKYIFLPFPIKVLDCTSLEVFKWLDGTWSSLG